MTGRVGGARSAVTVALVNDYEVVVARLRGMLAPYPDRIAVVDTEVGGTQVAAADVAVFDTLGGQRHALDRAQALVARHNVGHVVIYARDPSPAFVLAAEEVGVDLVIDKSVAGEELVNALEAVAADRPVTARSDLPRPSGSELAADDGADGKPVDDELLALLAKGLSNERIADELFVPERWVRAALEALYGRLQVGNRAEAAMRAVRLGLLPTRHGRGVPTGPRRSKRFPAEPAAVRQARSFVTGVLGRAGASDSDVQAFRLAVSELGANVVMHGAGHSWTVGLRATPNGFVMDVSGGVAATDDVVFRPDQWAIADPNQASGRGLGIVRETMDGITTERWRGKVRVVCWLGSAIG
jgi:DNA-binding NarL/FixJ family response regulator/anti-sigma regulatory factor (Ser/Thr protein kinase)